ncbi:unnamed protein product [Orchesella dallaii]|uniref:UDP-glucuronosyltransferase n=1 Tax=Orchesella dallaii TaxID=48710 RepID=A0ABP1RWG3_9HEXA
MKLQTLIISTFAVIGLVQISEINGANILFYMVMASYSHRAPLQPLIDTLAERGHNVTFLSAFPAKTPNPKVIEFNPPKVTKYMNQLMGFDFDVYKYRKDSEQILQVWLNLPPLAVEACEHLYSDSEVLKWLNTSTFDIVVMDSLYNECAYGVAYHFKAKIIPFGTALQYPWFGEAHFGIPDETSSIPDGMTHMPPNMNFFQRIVTALTPLMWKAYRELWILPKLEEISRKGLGLKEIPRFVDMDANTSLVFVNSHWVTEYPRSYPPNVVPVGGIAWHGKVKPLPKKLEDFINKGKNGFILVSFGTVAEFTRFDPHIRKAFVNTIIKFPNIQFIWKSTFPIEEILPENVIVEKWLPQKDVLAHPKIRAFITHGGLGSIYESVLSKVPMICFPILAEQEHNAISMMEKGFGIKLELVTLKEEELTDALSQVLTNESYKRNVEKVARLFTDRPISPLDTAVWWIEFLLRNPDSAELLRPLSARQSWWVRRQLDVWAFVFIVAIVIISIPLLIVYSVSKFILKKVFGSSNKAKAKLKVN